MELNVILKSGHVIENVKAKDKTKSVVGLWVWSTKQAVDQLLSFDGITIRSSEIAAIENHENIDITVDNLPWDGDEE